MTKVSKTEVDKKLRDEVFEMLIPNTIDQFNGTTDFHKINDRQYGILLTDANGEQRYIRIGAIVAELRDDMTAEELMQSEINAYQAKQEKKAEKAKEKAEKIKQAKEKVSE